MEGGLLYYKYQLLQVLRVSVYDLIPLAHSALSVRNEVQSEVLLLFLQVQFLRGFHQRNMFHAQWINDTHL